jgi:hypothetical protein
MVALTIGEACNVLEPRLTPEQLRAIIAALGWRPDDIRRNGHVGRPRTDQYAYDWAKLSRLHEALMPFLRICA